MKLLSVALAIVFTLPCVAFAGEKMPQHKAGMTHMTETTSKALPIEGGQSAFAAIQEIIAMLEGDPKSDWSKVDIEALRQHLIDMDNVTLHTVVKVTEASDSFEFSVSGESAIVGSIQRMISGHIMTMNGVDGWKFSAESNITGAVMSVTPPDKASMVKLRALGFIGVMAQGMHHQQHHWMLANGMMPHK